MSIINAAGENKTVADPNAEYTSLYGLWLKSRAVCSGERFVKDYDSEIDVTGEYKNLLIPFSPSMSAEQYKFYKAEAEFPGITAQFSKMLVGGLLRKQPILSFPDNIDESIKDWIVSEFGQDDSPLSAFLASAITEELQTSRCWICVDFPKITNPDNITNEELLNYKPYPIMWPAELIINWKLTKDQYGKKKLERVIIKQKEKEFTESEFHPIYRDTVRVYELMDNKFQIRVFQRSSKSSEVPVSSGKEIIINERESAKFDLVETIVPLMHGQPLTFIPAWPLNGMIAPVEPVLMPFIDKEVSLYNKLSRRNHLLYSASTYTPIISSDMADDKFIEITEGGLGTWIKLGQGDTATVLETPTTALADMDRAIAANVEDLAKMGIRMLSPEVAQSGIALELRNASQAAQLGTLNTQIGNTMKQIIVFMINWRYNIELDNKDVKFQLSSDFSNTPLGVDWVRLATEWYENGHIPRDIWLQILKQNDVLDPDYDDEAGQQKILEEQEFKTERDTQNYIDQTRVQHSLAMEDPNNAA